MTAAPADRPADVVRDLSDQRHLFDALAAIRAKEADLAEHRRHLVEQIQAALGEQGTVGTIDGRTVVTWRETTRTTLDQKAIRANVDPEVVEKCTKTSVVRSFRFTEGER